MKTLTSTDGIENLINEMQYQKQHGSQSAAAAIAWALAKIKQLNETLKIIERESADDIIRTLAHDAMKIPPSAL